MNIWQSSIEYQKDDICIYDGAIYLSLINNNINEQFKDSDWQNIVNHTGVSFHYLGSWKSDMKYVFNDIVSLESDNNNQYLCKRENIDETPNSSDAWVPFGNRNICFKGFMNEEEYNVNDIVYQDNKFMRKTEESWEELFDFNWIKVNEVDRINKISYNDFWEKSYRYEENDIVKDSTNFDNVYICISKHVSINPPSKDSIHWKVLFYNITFRHIWNKNEIYYPNSIVIDEHTNSLYINRSMIQSEVSPYYDKDNWTVIFDSEWIKPDSALVGRPGRDGEKGEKGDIGEKGESGDIGMRGPPGERGLRGEKGDRGEKGERGDRGKKGETGERGKSGKDGKDGIGIKGERGDKGDSIIFRGEWTKNREYEEGDIVRDMTDFGSLYVCRTRPTLKAPPSKERGSWEFLLGDFMVYRGHWSENDYKKNHLVLHESIIYICKRECISRMSPDIDYENWDIFFSSLWFDKSNQFFLGFFSNDTCCTEYSSGKQQTMYTQRNCNHHSLEDSNIYDHRRMVIKDTFYEVPINCIGHMTSLFNYNPNYYNLIISEEGVYRITYNIEYHGSIFNVIGLVTEEDLDLNTRPQTIRFSVNKSNNQIDSGIERTFYEGTEDVEEITEYLNHTFYYTVTKNKNDKTNYLLKLKLKFLDNNYNRVLYLHSLNCWMGIEKIK